MIRSSFRRKTSSSPSTRRTTAIGKSRFAFTSTIACPAAEGPRERDFNMRWIASLVADCYRILIRGGVFLYPGDKRKGYGAGRLRLVYEANPVAFLVEQAGGAATDGVNRILDIVPAGLHAAHAAGLRRQGRGYADRALSHRPEHDRRTLAAVRQSRPVQGVRGEACQRNIPIISITGSSGAGTTTVEQTSSRFSTARSVTAAFIEGDAFHRYDRQAMKDKVAEEKAAGTANFTHFNAEANELEILESVFEEYGRKGTGRTRHYVHDEEEAKRIGVAPGNFTDWEQFGETDLLFYEGLHGCVVTDKVDLARHCRSEDRRRSGHQSGMDPEDPSRQGGARLFHRSRDRHDPAPHARLCALHLSAILADRHQFPARADRRHLEPVHRPLDTDAGRVDACHPLRQSARHRFSLSACR